MFQKRLHNIWIRIPMPTIQSMQLPVPSNWQDFETIVRDAQAQRWKSTTLQKNGRSGQQQQGVDIYGPDDSGRPVGIQCKRYKDPLRLKDITVEIESAENFNGHLNTLFLATTTDYDAKLQQQVRLLSETRVAQDKFAIGLLFWDDIVSGLLLNPAVFRAHYPQIALQHSAVIDKERQIAALELGYFGSDLWEYVILVHGELGWMAQADPDELIATLRILERRSQQMLTREDAGPILVSLAKVRDGCLSEKNQKSDWELVEIHAKRASTRLKKASSLLSLEEANVLDVGLQLGRIYHYTDDLPSPKVRADIEDKVRTILCVASDSLIKQAFSEAEALSSGYRWAMRIYSLLNREIRYRL
jgi:hypothetical protein